MSNTLDPEGRHGKGRLNIGASRQDFSRFLRGSEITIGSCDGRRSDIADLLCVEAGVLKKISAICSPSGEELRRKMQ